MKKNYRIISIIFIVSFLVLSVPSCSLASSGTSSNISATTKRVSDETSSSFNLTEELNTLKEKLVNPPVITSHKPFQELSSNSGKELVIIKGKSDTDTSIALKVNGVLIDKKYTVDSSGNFETGDGVEIVEGTNTVEVYAVNADGDKSDPTKLTFFLNTQQDLYFMIYENADSLSEISSQFYSKEIEPLVYIRGVALPLVDVFLKVNDKIIGQTLSGETGVFSFSGIQLSQGSNIISAWYSSGDSQPSTQVDKEINVSKDLVSPDPSSLTGYIDSNGNHLSWVQSTDIEFVSYKIVRVDDPAKNPHYPENDVIATITDKNILNYTDTDIVAGKAYFYTLWILDDAGNLTSSNVLPLPTPKYAISINRLPVLQANIIARRGWYYEYFELTNTGNVPVYIQPILVWFLLEPESDKNLTLNPLWAVYIWDPSTGTYYYENTDIREAFLADWVEYDSSRKSETESIILDPATQRVTTKTKTIIDGDTKTAETINYVYDANGRPLTTTTIVMEIKKIGEENISKRVLILNKTTTVTVENHLTGTSTTTSENAITRAIVAPENVNSTVEPIEPGDKIKLVIKIANVAADKDDKIVVHFNFAPADSSGYYFMEDIISTGDIFVTSSGK